MPQHYYRKTSLKDLPDEEWKDIPGFEDMYQISNYGRVKSLSREIALKNNRVRRTNTIIMKPGNRKYFNNVVKKTFYCPSIGLCKEGITYHFGLARLLYIVFIENLDYYSDDYVVTLKDKLSFLHSTNLKKSNRTNVLLESYSKGWQKSHLSELSIPITQYDASGNPIAQFSSIYEASKKTGFTGRVINYLFHGKGHIYKGCFWKEGHNTEKLEVSKIKLNVEQKLVNEELIEHLGIKNLDYNKLPPYLNLSPESLEGEIWKDIPGYEGLYQISNLGRVKALQKVSYGKIKKWKPEQIKRLTVLMRTDRHKKKIPARTVVTMSKNGIKNQLSIQRFVYYLFVKEFDLDDPRFVVYFNDANPLNAKLENLYLQETNRAKKVFKRKNKTKTG